MSFANKVVLVTGAAAGIGAAIALKFAKLSASLCITDKNEKGLLKTQQECEISNKAPVLEIVADLSKDNDVVKIVENVLKKFGKIDVLINCAGIMKITSLQDSGVVDKLDEVFSINIRAAVFITKQALPALVKSKGCIVNISSICSTFLTEHLLVYNMSKAAMTNFTKSAAFELASHGIRVNCMSPGPVKTNLMINAGVTEEESFMYWKNLTDQTPLKKCVKAEEIAELAAYLASDKAACITGSDFVIDAGLLLGLPATVSESITKNGV